MDEIARMLTSMALSIALPLAVQRWDKARLSEAQRARAWNFASWACALINFGPLSMLGWGVVTRGPIRGGAVGLALAAVLLLAISGVDWALERLLL